MPKKKSYLTVTDQFCGCGGSGSGVQNYAKKNGGGVEVKLALNHWKLATETYGSNIASAKVDCTDVSACDPRRYESTDILITSPECTTHSPAGGNTHRALKKQMDIFNKNEIDPATERSRATMWDVCRFAEYHNYNLIIAENVVEAKTRWPLFDNWLGCMHTLGYNHKCVYLNSKHFHPTPQSRDRMYVIFWKKGNAAPDLEYKPLAYCGKCGRDIRSIQTWKRHDRQYGKYGKQYVYCCPQCTTIVEPYYYAAFNCIDWSDIGQKIGERKKDLSPNTRNRIKYGLNKYSEPFYVANYSPGYSKTLSNSLGTITCQDHHGLVVPFIIKGEHSKSSPIVSSILETIHTQVTRQTMSLVTPPFLTEMHSNGYARPISSELNTITAGGIKNGIVTDSSWNSFIAQYNNGSHCTRHISGVLGTQSTIDSSAIITYQKPTIDECFYRMLKAKEVKLGMAFNPDYIILGDSKEQVNQLGNAVTPPAMEWLIGQGIKSLCA